VPPDELSEHPDLSATGAAMRAAWRAEEEAATRDAAEHWQHNLALADRMRAYMHHGDAVAVVVAGRRLTGLVEEVGADLLALRTASGRVELHLTATIPLEVTVSAPARAGGDRGTDAGGSFRGALLARERDARVLLGTLADPDGRAGALTVAADHVVLHTGDAEIAVPLASIAWISPAPE
jgi:hypothetical protein